MAEISPTVRALAALIEDRDPVVRECVDAYLLEHFQEIEHQLLDILDSQVARGKAGALLEKFMYVNGEITLNELRRCVSKKDQDCVYEWFLLNKMILPTVSFNNLMMPMFSIVDTVDRKVLKDMSPRLKLETLSGIFFGDLKMEVFDGKDIPLSALLPSDVVESKSGIRLVVDMLYVFLADLLGFPMKVLITDTEFFPVWTDNKGDALLYVNLSEGGRVIDAGEFVSPSGRSSLDSIRSLLDIYVSLMSDIFSVSGETQRSEMMMKAYDILSGR